jgi:hypothetical protein
VKLALADWRAEVKCQRAWSEKKHGKGDEMGEYFKVVNITKRQFLCPHSFGDGAKLLEFGSGGGTMQALTVLLSTRPFDHDGENLAGSWAGDRVVIVGDYADDEGRKYVRQCLGEVAPAEVVQELLVDGDDNIPDLYSLCVRARDAKRDPDDADRSPQERRLRKMVPFEDISPKLHALLRANGERVPEPL